MSSKRCSTELQLMQRICTCAKFSTHIIQNSKQATKHIVIIWAHILLLQLFLKHYFAASWVNYYITFKTLEEKRLKYKIILTNECVHVCFKINVVPTYNYIRISVMMSVHNQTFSSRSEYKARAFMPSRTKNNN